MNRLLVGCILFFSAVNIWATEKNTKDTTKSKSEKVTAVKVGDAVYNYDEILKKAKETLANSNSISLPKSNHSEATKDLISQHIEKVISTNPLLAKAKVVKEEMMVKDQYGSFTKFCVCIILIR